MKLRLRQLNDRETHIAFEQGAQYIPMACPGREHDPLFNSYVELQQLDDESGRWVPVPIETVT